MQFIVVTTKGGAGKTMVASNLLASYVFQKHGGTKPVRYVEIDDQNQGVRNLAVSNFITAQTIKTEMLERFAMELILENVDAVIDVGGNLTAKMFLDSINDIGSLRGNAVYFVPMLDSKQDLQNALETYFTIRNADSVSKIIFVLNRAVNKNNKELLEEQFLDFFGRKELDIEPALADITDAYFLALNFDFAYNKLAQHKKTLVEISMDDVKDELNEAIALNREDPKMRDKALKLLYHEKLINACRRIYDNEYIPLFKQIDKIMEG